MTTKTNKFVDDVYSAVKKVRGLDMKIVMTALAIVNKPKLYEFLEAADEAHDDASQVAADINLKELGYGQES